MHALALLLGVARLVAAEFYGNVPDQPEVLCGTGDGNTFSIKHETVRLAQINVYGLQMPAAADAWRPHIPDMVTAVPVTVLVELNTFAIAAYGALDNEFNLHVDFDGFFRGTSRHDISVHCGTKSQPDSKGSSAHRRGKRQVTINMRDTAAAAELVKRGDDNDSDSADPKTAATWNDGAASCYKGVNLDRPIVARKMLIDPFIKLSDEALTACPKPDGWKAVRIAIGAEMVYMEAWVGTVGWLDGDGNIHVCWDSWYAGPWSYQLGDRCKWASGDQATHPANEDFDGKIENAGAAICVPADDPTNSFQITTADIDKHGVLDGNVTLPETAYAKCPAATDYDAGNHVVHIRTQTGYTIGLVAWVNVGTKKMHVCWDVGYIGRDNPISTPCDFADDVQKKRKSAHSLDVTS
ncbi:hypothetical protein PYCC9005_001566 [Savitreella phatthalungensis]